MYDKDDANELNRYKAWNIAGFIVIGLVLLNTALFCSGCTSGADAVEPDIIKLERRIAELETINRDLTERLDSTTNSIGRTKEIADQCRDRIEHIKETARGINDIVERIEYLFTQYEYEVSRVLNEINTSGAYDIDINSD